MALRFDRSSTLRLSYDALGLSLALLLSYLESLVPLSLPVPGLKLGLPNLAIMFLFFRVNRLDAAIVSLLRVLCVSLLVGNVTGLLFSLLGAVCAYAVLLFFFAGKDSPIRLLASSLCGAAHVFGQMIAAVILYGTPILLYLPVLLVGGLLLGALLGWLLIRIDGLLEKAVGQ